MLTRRDLITASAASCIPVPVLASGVVSARKAKNPVAFNSGIGNFTCLDIYGNFAIGNWVASPPSYNYMNTYVSDGYMSWNTTLPQTMPSFLMAQLLETGVNVLRLVVDPGPLILATTSQFQALMAQIQSAVSNITGSGLNCIVDMHVRPYASLQLSQTGYGLGDTEIVNAAPGGYWTNYVNTVSAVGAYLDANNSASQVALELFNEPPVSTGTQPWTVSAPALATAVRSAAPHLTLLVAGDSYAAIGTAGYAGLLNLTPTLFDDNTIFVFHDYNPSIFSGQSNAGQGAFGYVENLEFPPIVKNCQANLSTAKSNVDMDMTLSPTQKTSYKNAITDGMNGSITLGGTNSYYYGPQTNGYPGPQDIGYIKSLHAQVAGWADEFLIARSRIWMGEFGANGNGSLNQQISGIPLPGATAASKAAFLSAKRLSAIANGFSWGLWALLPGSNGGDGFPICTVSSSTYTINNTYLTALGLYNV